jgi:hypothetical protein
MFNNEKSLIGILMNELNIVNTPNTANTPNVISGRCYFCRDVDAKPHEAYNHILCDSCNTKLNGIIVDYTKTVLDAILAKIGLKI